MPQKLSNKQAGTRWLKLLGWLAPVACLAMAWISMLALDKEQEVLETRLYFAQKTETERVVDRLESVLRVLFTKESALDQGVFRSYVSDPTSVPRGARFASPLFNPNTERSPFKRIHFELGPGAVITHPELPTGDDLTLAKTEGHITKATLDRARNLATRLAEFAPPQVLINLLLLTRGDATDAADRAIPEGPFRAFFVPIRDGGQIVRAELLILRGVGSETRTRALQGVWLDWPALRASLQEIGEATLVSGKLSLEPSALDILGPGAPASGKVTAGRDTGQLGSLALNVKITGRLTEPPFQWSATMTSLSVAWVVFLASLASLYVALKRSAALAEQRARFASAVTHELRTPLTTFCMYTAMLKDGMVKGEEKQMEYFETLYRESDRLRHIVDNVLQNAGLEQGSSGPQLPADSVQAAELVKTILPLMERRCVAGKFEFEGMSAGASGLEGLALRVTPQNVERILVNLVDNACKYGAGEHASICFWAEVTSDQLLLYVRDFGPGVPASFEPQLFTAYERGPAEPNRPSGSSEEGLGLGLSLSRELARTMGGDLSLVRGEPKAVPSCKGDASKVPGATFCLALPLA